ncbi:hypothetical protein P280DRAFT_473622 [Massarina eburnea CBS 473.64]|uniref:Uncharacterized protein n=1 Tax=Massarina eburnea CBS 473.64 TaxID=1395130 RepID=A0A6A6RKJ8_9PLEO|nr:hypothetical protein P280DRAFT_473622 [Massarina eburnea CBS 473.64]
MSAPHPQMLWSKVAGAAPPKKEDSAAGSPVPSPSKAVPAPPTASTGSSPSTSHKMTLPTSPALFNWADDIEEEISAAAPVAAIPATAPTALTASPVPSTNVATQLHLRIQEPERELADLQDMSDSSDIMNSETNVLKTQLHETKVQLAQLAAGLHDQDRRLEMLQYHIRIDNIENNRRLERLEKDRRIERLEKQLEERANSNRALQVEIEHLIKLREQELIPEPEPQPESDPEKTTESEGTESEAESDDSSSASAGEKQDVGTPEIKAVEPPFDIGDFPALPSAVSSDGAAPMRETPEPVETSDTVAMSETASSMSSASSSPADPKPQKVDTVFKPEDFPAIIGSPKTRDLTEPIFATPETIKKVEPVPPAPKLKLGLDMSKFGHKAPVVPSAPSNAHRAYNLATKPDMVPTIMPDVDVRKMQAPERFAFGNGPTVTVKMGSEVLGHLPQYILRQCSEMANAHWEKNPGATSITFPANSMSKDAAMRHIDWMTQQTVAEKVFSIHLDQNENDRAHRSNLELVRAARVMGMTNIYVGHFTRHYCEKIRRGKVSQSLMSHIAQVAYLANDPIFDCLATNLAAQRQRKTIPDPASFEKFLEEHKDLAARMDEISSKKTRSAS